MSIGQQGNGIPLSQIVQVGGSTSGAGTGVGQQDPASNAANAARKSALEAEQAAAAAAQSAASANQASAQAIAAIPAAAAAQQAAQAAEMYANETGVDAANSALSAQEAQEARNQAFAALTGERYGVATRADLNALTGVTIGEVRAVTNDPTVANNGAWRKTGAGASDWTQATDRTTQLSADVATLSAGAASLASPGVDTPSALGFVAAGANIFNKDAVTPGVALNLVNGGTYAAAGYAVSAYMRVAPGETYVANGNTRACYYGLAKNFISSTPSAITSLTIPAGCMYLRIDTAAPLATYMLAKGALPSVYTPYFFEFKATAGFPLRVTADALSASGASAATQAVESKPILNLQPRSVPSQALQLLQQTANLFDSSNVTSGVAINTANGGTYTAAGWVVSAYIAAKPGTQYTVTGGHMAFYNSSQGFISATGASSLPNPSTVMTPANCAFVRIDSSNPSVAMLIEGATLPAGYVAYGFVIDPASKVRAGNYPWSGKSWCVLGDSITAAKQYQPRVAAATGLVVALDFGVPGRPVRAMDDELTASNLAPIDLVTIFGGTNDYGGNRPLGTIADAYDGSTAATFYNDVYQVLANIYTLKPSVRVAVFTPLMRGAFEAQPVYPAANSSGSTLPQYVQAMKEVCALFATPVLDLFATSGINLKNLSTFTSDNLHPSIPAGYARISPVMSSFINNVV